METQIAPVYLEGPFAQRPVAAIAPLGMIFHATDTLDTYLRAIDPATNLARWDLVGGGGSGSLSNKYWVNAPGQTPSTGYTTISAAVADAVSAGGPAAIFILPGTYTESVTLPDNISVAAPAGFGTVFIQGNIILSGTTGTNALSDLVILGDVIVSGSASQPIRLSLLRTLIIANAGDNALSLGSSDTQVTAMECTFSGGVGGGSGLACDAGHTGCSGTFTDCAFSGRGDAAIRLLSTNWQFIECRFSTRDAAASVLEGASAISAVSAMFTNCLFSSDKNAATTAVIIDSGAGQWSFIGAGTSIYSMVAGVVLVSGGGGALAIAQGGPNLGSFLVANLPALSLNGDTIPAYAFTPDGHKAGGGATGVGVYFDPASSSWLTNSGDIAP